MKGGEDGKEESEKGTDAGVCAGYRPERGANCIEAGRSTSPEQDTQGSLETIFKKLINQEESKK